MKMYQPVVVAFAAALVVSGCQASGSDTAPTSASTSASASSAIPASASPTSTAAVSTLATPGAVRSTVQTPTASAPRRTATATATPTTPSRTPSTKAAARTSRSTNDCKDTWPGDICLAWIEGQISTRTADRRAKAVTSTMAPGFLEAYPNGENALYCADGSQTQDACPDGSEPRLKPYPRKGHTSSRGSGS